MEQCRDSSSPQEKLKKHLGCQKELLEDGLMKDCSLTSDLPEGNACTISQNISAIKRKQIIHKPPQKKKEFATVESLPKVKKTICKGRSPTCKHNSQTIKSSQTLDQELISNERVSEPLWSSRARDLSQRLWLPTATDCVGSLSNYSNGSFTSMESNSWFSMKVWSPQGKQSLPKTSLPSSMFSIVESMVKESTKRSLKTRTNNLRKRSQKPIANCARKIRLFPNNEDASRLRQWFGCCRKTYNMALGAIVDDPNINISLPDLRKQFVNANAIPDDMKYLLDTPKQVRDGALDDLVTAYKSNFTKKKKDPNHQFKINFRSKKETQSIVIQHTDIKMIKQDQCMKMYPTFLTNVIKYKLRLRDMTNQKQLDTVDYTSRLIMDKLGRFYLCVPYHAIARDNQTSGWVAMDPGVRTFQTLYCPTNNVAYKIGDKDMARIFRLCMYLDKIKNKKASVRLQKKIKNLVNEVHWKTINFLIKNFQNVLLPSFEVSNMVKRGERKISKENVRKMLTWSHYTFKRRLLTRTERETTNVYIVGEEYTTKTCTSCMTVNNKVGGNKVFKCSNCGLKIDRDLSGARNIFLRNIELAASGS